MKFTAHITKISDTAYVVFTHHIEADLHYGSIVFPTYALAADYAASEVSD